MSRIGALLRSPGDVDVELLRRRRLRRRDRARRARPPAGRTCPGCLRHLPDPEPTFLRSAAAGAWLCARRARRSRAVTAHSPTAPAATTARSASADARRRIVTARPPTSGRHRPARCTGCLQPEPGIDLAMGQRHFMHLCTSAQRRHGGGESLRRARPHPGRWFEWTSKSGAGRVRSRCSGDSCRQPASARPKARSYKGGAARA